MKIRSAVLELFHAYRKTVGANSIGSPHGCERAANCIHKLRNELTDQHFQTELRAVFSNIKVDIYLRSSELAQATTLSTCIREMPSSNFSRDTDYPNGGFHGLPQSFQPNVKIAL
jgi:hypothetical protein